MPSESNIAVSRNHELLIASNRVLYEADSSVSTVIILAQAGDDVARVFLLPAYSLLAQRAYHYNHVCETEENARFSIPPWPIYTYSSSCIA
jgi:hypothetical protein